MLTKRLLNQLLSANTIHSILGSFYFGNFLPSNSLGQNLRYLANNIDMTLKEQTMFHSKIMHCSCVPIFISSLRSSNSHSDLLVTHPTTPLCQITPVLNTGLSLSEPLQLYKGYNAIQRQSLDSSADYMYILWVQQDTAAR